MAEIDWKSPTASEGDIEVTMVSPSNPEQTYGLLKDVKLDGSKVTGAYYTDTRTSGNLSYVGTGWTRGTFLRVAYKIPKFNYSRVIGTYVATDDAASRSKNLWTTKLTLQSGALYTLSTEKMEKPWTLASGAMAKTAIKQILQKSSRPYKDLSRNDYKTSSPLVLETGKNVLEWIYALCTLANLRLDCDPDGYVTINDYVAPSSKTPSYILDLHEERGVVLDGISRSSDYLSVPGRAIVSYKYTEQVKGDDGKTTSVEHEITGSADAKGYASPQSRGYVITDYHSVNELTPQTAAHAEELARQYINENSKESVEWEITTTYLPLWEGDVVEFHVYDGEQRYTGTRKCLIKTIDIDLSNMQLSLTLKEV